MRIAVDLDGTILSFPDFFKEFFKAMQSTGNSVGILTRRPDEESKKMIEVLASMGIKPDFYVGMPRGIDKKNYPAGIFKGIACKDLEIDVLFDDFESDNPQMLADFFSVNQHTEPF